MATTSKGMPESAAQKPAPMQQQQVQKQQTTDDLKAKADALRKQVLSTWHCIYVYSGGGVHIKLMVKTNGIMGEHSLENFIARLGFEPTV